MRSYKSIIYSMLIVFTSILMSCSQKQSNTLLDNSFKYTINIKEVKNTVKFEDIVSEYRYVKLETAKECLLGEIGKVLIHDKKIYILSKGVYCFDQNGKFLFAINKIGKAPYEFINPTDLSIDNDKLYLYDNSQSKVIVFNAQNGHFKNSFSLDYSVVQLQIIGNYLISNRGSIPNQFIKGTERVSIGSLNEMDKLQSFFPFNSYDISIENQFYSYNKNAYWIDPLFNTVFKIDGDKVSGYLKLNYINHNVIKADLVTPGFSLKKLREDNKSFYLSNVYETSDLIVGDFMIGESPSHLIYNKRENTISTFKEVITKAYESAPYAQAVSGDFFCRIIPNLDLRIMKNEIREKNINLEKNDSNYSNYNIIKNFNENDNPIVAFYMLKTAAQ